MRGFRAEQTARQVGLAGLVAHATWDQARDHPPTVAIITTTARLLGALVEGNPPQADLEHRNLRQLYRQLPDNGHTEGHDR
jgi:hypothetical protein